MAQTPKIAGIAITPKIMAEMQALEEADITVDSGVQGDARGTKRQRQITILFEDDWNDAVAETTGGDLNWIERRANIFVAGMRAPQKEGGIFTIGEVTMEVTLETQPCDLMEQKRTGLKKALTPHWRGGVCCKVLSGGHIAIGDSLTYQD